MKQVKQVKEYALMTLSWLGVRWFAVLSAILFCDITEAANRPNVLLIMADDFGYECLGCNGGESYTTPHLDQLAAAGVRFTHAHSQPVCTPSRVKLMTGMSNVRNYVDFGLLSAGSRTFGHMLQEAGYRTAVVGKWQLLGYDAKRGRGTHPRDAGFDDYCLWQVKQRKSRYWKPVIEQNGTLLETTSEDYGPDIFCDFAIDFMRVQTQKAKPFFVYFPMALTHNPFVPTPLNRTEKQLGAQGRFGGMVTYADLIVGRLVGQLEKLGIADQTLVLFTGDNGSPEGIVSRWNGQDVMGGKSKTTDAGTHVPLIASWPGTVPPRVCHDLIDFSDFFPTLTEVCGGTNPPESICDGRSFLPQLRGEVGRPRESLFCFYHPRPQGSGEAIRFARDQRWKLYGDGQLFDLESDPQELAAVTAEEQDGAAGVARRKLQAVLDAMPAELAAVSQR